MSLVTTIFLILARLYTTWDIWVVIGALLIIKAVLIFAIPHPHKDSNDPKKKK